MATDFLTGRLLVATPGLTDPNFARAVVLVLSHSAEGALGIVLNRPGALPLPEVLPRWAHLAAPPDVVFIGGPVQPENALCLAETPAGWRTMNVDEDPDATDVTRIRLFAAYAGWSAEQLEAEIEVGGWYIANARSDDVFSAAPALLWREVLRRQSGRAAFASTAPDDPGLN